eukprot:6432619-Prymnesium_polylepis.3
MSTTRCGSARSLWHVPCCVAAKTERSTEQAAGVTIEIQREQSPGQVPGACRCSVRTRAGKLTTIVLTLSCARGCWNTTPAHAVRRSYSYCRDTHTTPCRLVGWRVHVATGRARSKPQLTA